MVVAALMLLVMALFSIVLNHVRVAERVECAMEARNRAESLLAVGIQKVLAEPSFGSQRRPEDTLRLPGRPPEEALLTFNADVAGAEGVAWSTNNLSREGSSAPGWQGRVVPASSVHLVALGRYRGVGRQVEAVVGVPPFPYVMACQGRIHANGGLLVGAVDPALPAGTGPLDPDALGRGHLASNSLDSQAIRLGPGTRVTGDVRAPGRIEITGQSRVDGRVWPGAPAVTIPRIELAGYDPVALGKPQVQILTEMQLSGPVLEGYARRAGRLQVDQGMTLRGALLYVDGDLDLRGGLQGTGCVVVTGRARLEGNSRLHADNLAALLVGGDLSLEGTTPGNSGSNFQGLIYGQGGIFARDTTLMGVLLSTGTQDVHLVNSALVYVPQYTRVDFTVGGSFLYFDDEGRLIDPTEEDLPDARVSVQRGQDGTFTVRDTQAGTQFPNLSLEQAVQQISTLVALYDDDQEGLDQEDQDKVRAALGAMAPAGAAAAGAGTDAVVVDPNEFLGLQQKARVLLWRDLP